MNRHVLLSVVIAISTLGSIELADAEAERPAVKVISSEASRTDAPATDAKTRKYRTHTTYKKRQPVNDSHVDVGVFVEIDGVRRRQRNENSVDQSDDGPKRPKVE